MGRDLWQGIKKTYIVTKKGHSHHFRCSQARPLQATAEATADPVTWRSVQNAAWMRNVRLSPWPSPRNLQRNVHHSNGTATPKHQTTNSKSKPSNKNQRRRLWTCSKHIIPCHRPCFLEFPPTWITKQHKQRHFPISAEKVPFHSIRSSNWMQQP